ncbi:MAG TPA: tRNA-dihydrouridine synthase family protein [Fibrobacteria bacterium]|jgi:nifR3 family TIM-barrel protein|nr:tRNA-dihydrouridine synthase family protein [Fibrobacteria bacterium]
MADDAVGPASLLARASRVRQSFDIAGRRIWPNAYLAPMSGVTDICFRRLVSRLAQGRTGLLVSEFVSVQVLTQEGGRENSKSAREMAFTEEERPFSIQIFGAEPGKMAEGARIAAATGCDFIEINCGCPAPKVVGKGGGSGLLKDLPNLANILRSVKAAVDVPVTIKVRVGWNDDLITLFETLKIAEGEGAAAFVIHGRTRAQGYKGLANWDLIAEAKRRAPKGLPVIGNGDIVRPEDVLHRLETYGVDGVAVGRGAMHNPWIFGQIADLYEGKMWREPGKEDFLGVFSEYESLLRGEMDIELRVLGKLKQMAARILKGLPGGSLARLSLLRSQSVEEFRGHLHAYFEGMGEVRRDYAALAELNGGENTEVVSGLTYKN